MNVVTEQDEQIKWDEAAALVKGAARVCALTGAGISVASGIPDFRSAGGLWSVYSPEEYATLQVFYANPAKAWRLYRALGRVLLNKKANPAHRALAQLERQGLLAGIVTQNVDNLHQQAGSRCVLEIHGDHQQLECLQCRTLEPFREEHLQVEEVPACGRCSFPLKPNVVLFGEPVRLLEEIDALLAGCDLLLVIGTSAQVYPAASIPAAVKRNGGLIFEFNRDQALGRDRFAAAEPITDYFFPGPAELTLPRLCRPLAGRA